MWRGDDLVGFAHHSYGVFLAARFLHRHRSDTRRASNLLAQEPAGRQRVVPQLAGVAVWLTGRSPGLGRSGSLFGGTRGSAG